MNSKDETKAAHFYENLGPTSTIIMSEKTRRYTLREGWTTGTCASAAAKAATLLLLGEKIKDNVDVELPLKGRKANLKIHRFGGTKNIETFATTIKDAGDDPDVTHGAEIGAIVRFSDKRGIWIKGGEGVGRVTKPGLGLEVGEADITYVPRKMIRRAVISALESFGIKENEIALEVEIFVPEGKERAKKTLLERLGVIGGIGILGTTGIVVPYSTGAWKATIARQISVAKGSGVDVVVATTGQQSEELARKFLSDLPDISFVDVGDFIGFTLKYSAQKGIKKFILAGFPAKISKFAKGELFTHSEISRVDLNFLVSITKESYPDLSDQIKRELLESSTARDFIEKVKAFGLNRVFEKIAEAARMRCKEISDKIEAEILMFDYDGKVLHYAGAPI